MQLGRKGFAAPEVTGIEFTRTPSPTPDGTTFFRQILKRDYHTVTGSGNPIRFALNDTWALDSGLLTFPESQPNMAEDSPYFSPAAVAAFLSEGSGMTRAFGGIDFEMYLMWRSNTFDSIAVPIQKLSWSYSFDVTRSDIGGVENWIPSNGAAAPGEPSVPQNIAGVAWTALPEWSANSATDVPEYDD